MTLKEEQETQKEDSHVKTGGMHLQAKGSQGFLATIKYWKIQRWNLLRAFRKNEALLTPLFLTLGLQYWERMNF